MHRAPAPGPACTSLGPPIASGSFLLDLVHRGVMPREHEPTGSVRLTRSAPQNTLDQGSVSPKGHSARSCRFLPKS